MHASCRTAELPYSHITYTRPTVIPICFARANRVWSAMPFSSCVSQVQAAGQTAHSCIRGASIEACKRFRTIPPRAAVRLAPVG